MFIVSVGEDSCMLVFGLLPMETGDRPLAVVVFELKRGETYYLNIAHEMGNEGEKGKKTSGCQLW